MGCYDFFNFEKDFKFQNHKEDIVVIPGGNEYQTKDFESCMYCLQINKNNEIEKPCFEIIVNKEFPVGHTLRVNSRITHYEKINFTGVMGIYHYTDKIDYVYDLWIENGKIFKIEDKSK